MRRNVYAVIALAALIGLTAGCSGDEDVIAGSGLIEADEVLVSSETGGRVLEKFFDEGSEVKKDDVLLVIDTTRIDLNLQAARASRDVALANLEAARAMSDQAKETEQFARSEFERVTALRDSGTASDRQYDMARHEYRSAAKAVRTMEAKTGIAEAEVSRIDAEIARLDNELDDASPEAPISGTVLEEYIDEGELLSPGRPIAVIAGLDTVYVKVYLDAGSFAKVRIGDPAVVDTESGGAKLGGSVVWTADEAQFTPKNVQTAESRAGLVYAVKVSIPNPGHYLKVGMPVYVTLESK